MAKSKEELLYLYFLSFHDFLHEICVIGFIAWKLLFGHNQSILTINYILLIKEYHGICSSINVIAKIYNVYYF